MNDSKTIIGVDIAKRVFQIHEVMCRRVRCRACSSSGRSFSSTSSIACHA